MKAEYDAKGAKIAAEHLTVGYNGRPLIRDIALSLRPGEILTLIGPNGAGKSTILKSLTRHLAAISGTVYIDGRDMRSMRGRDVAAELAVVLTDRVRPELMTCRELVATGRYPYTGSFGMLTSHDREVVDRSLERVRALDIADRDFSAVSDGQRQRVMLARAICQEPEVIVLDEPASFLDIMHKIELLDILRSMAKDQGITVVMSLHEIDLADKVSDKIVCVKDGAITASGTPEEIFSDERIAALYGIERGSFNAALGSVELPRPRGDARCFVVGGNGRGIPYYRALQRLGVPFYAGILFENDLDMPVAKALAERVISAGAFCPIGDREENEAKELISKVGVLSDAGCEPGEFNRANGRLVEFARERGVKVVSSLKTLSEVFG